MSTYVHTNKHISTLIKAKLENLHFISERGAEHTNIDDLCKQSDFIIITSALTPDTHHLINRARLESMKPGAILINTSRGQLVDQEALIDVLKAKKIRGAGLDVMYPEPLPLDSPLLQLDNCGM